MDRPDHVVVLVLAAWHRSAQAWGLARLPLGSWPLRHAPGLAFCKVMGSGREGGFVLRPGLDHHGLFLLFEGEAMADRFVHESPLLSRYGEHAREMCVLKMRAFDSRGSWSGQRIAVTTPKPAEGPVASLTRGSVRISRLWPFWRHAPAAQSAVAQAQGCEIAFGMGEAPLVRQATFSLWRDQGAMDAYARSGPHLQAIQAATRGRHLSESMFVRFDLLAAQGSWKGWHPAAP